MGAPADDPGDDEQGGEEVQGEAEVVIEPGAGPVDVGGNFFLAPGGLFDDFRRLFEGLVAGFRRDGRGETFEDDGPGIAGFRRGGRSP